MKNVNQFVLNGLNELEMVMIRNGSFYPRWNTHRGNRCIIMNCTKLRKLEVRDESFFGYERLELKNLLSLQSIQIKGHVFCYFHEAALESRYE